MHRLVHLDLKGAPLRVPYLEKVLLITKQWGATGVLLEWEDTFPYQAELSEIGSKGNCGGDNMYSLTEVQHILWFAKENGLQAIQLIQTIGHMEFVLKHQAYRDLRESPRSPAVLCPSRPESQIVVRAMLKQALNVQPDAAYLHIGADEVWHTAVCPGCQARAAASQHRAASLYLDHIQDIATFVKKRRPNLTVLMWDDMLRSISVDALREYQMGSLVEPVVWNYNIASCFQIESQLWDKYRQVFPRVWAGTAFKGANGSCQILSPVSRYVSNHESWRKEVQTVGSEINFAGFILTGWSRYDHYATLCELLPVSLPSLASCLRVMTNPDHMAGSLVSDVLPSAEWPGEQLARCMHSFVIVRERCLGFLNGDMITTWLNPWQIENRYTNPVQIEGISVTAQQFLADLATLQTEISTHLYDITGQRSAQEWLQTYLVPIVKKLSDVRSFAANRVQCNASVRPLISGA